MAGVVGGGVSTWSPVQHLCCLKVLKCVLRLSAHFLPDITEMADMNGTLLPVHDVNHSGKITSSWQDEAVRGVQIALTLLIFLVRAPPHHHVFHISVC